MIKERISNFVPDFSTEREHLQDATVLKRDMRPLRLDSPSWGISNEHENVKDQKVQL